MSFDFNPSNRFQLIFFSALYFFSTFLFSPLTYPIITSDNAVHAYMAMDFSIPENLYYWGQDRLGSLLPMVGFVLFKATGWNPTICVSIVQALFFGAAIGLTVALFNDFWARMLIVIAILFPYFKFDCIQLIGHPYSSQLVTTGLAIWLYRASLKYQSGALMFLCSLMFGLSIWVSELSLLPLVLTIGHLAFMILHKRPSRISRLLAGLLAGLVASALFIQYAKAHFSGHKSYSGKLLTEPKIVFEKVLEFIRSNLYNLINKEEYSFNYILFMWACAILVSIALFFTWKQIKTIGLTHQSIITLILLFNLIISIPLITSIRWVELNGFPSRYYAYSYVSASVFAGFILELYSIKTFRILTVATSILLIYNGWFFVSHATNLPTTHSNYSSLKEFRSLGQAGYIGTYWHSYLFGFTDPRLIAATPHDKDNARCSECIEKVFSQPRLFLVKNHWFDSFPITLQQYGRTLKKKGEEFNVGPYQLAEYKIEELGKSVPLNPDTVKVLMSSFNSIEVADSNWIPGFPDSKRSFSGKYSNLLNPEHSFSSTFIIPVKKIPAGTQWVEFKGKVLLGKKDKAFAVQRFEANSVVSDFNVLEITPAETVGVWSEFSHVILYPQVIDAGQEYRAFIHFTTTGSILVDDLKVTFYGQL